MAMKIFITGVSGTGKTTIANILNNRGIHAISIEEVPNLCVWKNKATEETVNYEAELNKTFIDTHDWICDVKLLEELLNKNKDLTTIVLGSAANQNDFISFFDKDLLLQYKPETFIKRILKRKDTDFGKDESAQKLILDWYQEFEKHLIENGAIPVAAEQPKEKVVENIVNLVNE